MSTGPRRLPQAHVEGEDLGRTRLARFQLPIYFGLAFTITWAAQIPAYLHAHAHGYALTNEANVRHLLDLFGGRLDPAILPYPLLVMFAFGPTLAGLIVTALFKGRAGLADLARRITRVRIGSRWMLTTLLVPLALGVTSLALAFLVGGLQPIRLTFLLPLWLLPALLAYMLIFTALAEEIGWRGYALPELQRHHTAERASWLLGIAWGLWHLPANLLPPHLRGELTVGLATGVLFGLTIGIVGWTIVLTWFYNNTASVFWVIVIHGWFNTVQSYLVLSSGNYAAQSFYIVLPWVLALFLLKRYGSATLTRRAPASPAAPAD